MTYHGAKLADLSDEEFIEAIELLKRGNYPKDSSPIEQITEEIQKFINSGKQMDKLQSIGYTSHSAFIRTVKRIIKKNNFEVVVSSRHGEAYIMTKKMRDFLRGV